MFMDVDIEGVGILISSMVVFMVILNVIYIVVEGFFSQPDCCNVPPGLKIQKRQLPKITKIFLGLTQFSPANLNSRKD